MAKNSPRAPGTAADSERPNKGRAKHGSKRQRGKDSWALKVYSRELHKPVYTTVQASSGYEADIALAEFYVQVQRSEAQPTGRTTVGQYLDLWFASHQKWIRATTKRGYEQVIRSYIKPEIGHVSLGKLKPVQIRQMYDRLVDRVSPTTVMNAHRVLNKALKDGVRMEVIKRNPCEGVVAPRKSAIIYVDLRPEHLQQILEDVRGTRWETYLRLEIVTGMRRSELIGFEWDDVDLDNAQITVRRSLNLIPREGYVKGSTKTGKIRVLPIDRVTVELIKGRRVEYLEDRLRAGRRWHAGKTVFTRADGRPVSPNTLEKFWKKLRARIGLPAGTRLHDLRHALVTNLLAMGTDIKTVQDRLGHSTPMTTLEVYARVRPESGRRAADEYGLLVGNGGKHGGKRP